MTSLPRLLGPDRWPEARTLAGACGRPTADFEVGRQVFWGVDEGTRLVGLIGAEVYGEPGDEAALVRSMAVAPEFRGRGLAAALFGALEAWWGHRGPLVLLTETAEGFFAARGFVPIPRQDLPAGVQASAEVQGLCPVSARSMVRPV